jgi:DNA-binding transcriptional LysR family regulator
MLTIGNADRKASVLDGVSLDQLRAFIAAVDEGSFSGAGRKLGRVQSVVSDLVSNLEAQIGVTLFDRSGRFPKLTAEGIILLADARGIAAGVDGLKARAKGMASGLEPELSAVIDVFFPIEAITEAAKAFRSEFPGTPLRLYVEALGGAYQPVLDGRASFGVVGSLPMLPPTLTAERLAGVGFMMVARPDHPLASFAGIIPREELARHVQLVLTDRSDLSAGREFGVMSPATWRLADLFAKHAFLLNGLGWGGMPLHTVSRDIAEGRLVELLIEDIPPGGLVLPMSAVYPAATPPGPAGRWLIEHLKQCPGKLPAKRATPDRPA